MRCIRELYWTTKVRMSKHTRDAEMHKVKKLQIPESRYLTPVFAAWLGNFILTSSPTEIFFKSENISANWESPFCNFLVRHHTPADESEG